ncbi:DUF2917 domain-containing protein [bacterium]|nr:MAG: DUF2917 domain-containing protein [bacterium]
MVPPDQNPLGELQRPPGPAGLHLVAAERDEHHDDFGAVDDATRAGGRRLRDPQARRERNGMNVTLNPKHESKARLNLPAHPDAGLVLPKHGTVSLQDRGEGVELQVWTGKLWVTQEADGGDHIVGAGERFHTDGRGLVVIEALEAATFGAR